MADMYEYPTFRAFFDAKAEELLDVSDRRRQGLQVARVATGRCVVMTDNFTKPNGTRQIITLSQDNDGVHRFGSTQQPIKGRLAMFLYVSEQSGLRRLKDSPLAEQLVPNHWIALDEGLWYPREEQAIVASSLGALQRALPPEDAIGNVGLYTVLAHLFRDRWYFDPVVNDAFRV